MKSNSNSFQGGDKLPLSIPKTCETEKRLKINKLKRQLFQKVIVKSGSKQYDMEITEKYTFSDEDKLQALLEMLKETTSQWVKKSKDDQILLKDKLDEVRFSGCNIITTKLIMILKVLQGSSRIKTL